MYNPIPSIFGKEYKDGFEKNHEWASPSLRRHVETVNILTYVPTVIGLASFVFNVDIVGESEKQLKKLFK